MNKNIQNVKLPLRTRLKKRIGIGLQKKKQIIGLVFLSILAAVIISLFMTKYYRANGKIHLKYNSIFNSLLKNSGNFDNEINIFENDEFTKKIIEKLSSVGISLTRSELSESKEILIDGGSTTIRLRITGDDAEKSAKIVNSLIYEFSNASVLNNKSYLINAIKVISERENLLQTSINQDLNSTQGDILSSLTVDQENLLS